MSFAGSIPGKIDGVIFDFDDTLIWSEDNFRKAAAEFLARRGVYLSEREWDETIGLGIVRLLAGMKERHGLEGSFEDLMDEKNRIYLETALANTRPIPQTRRLVELLYDAGVPLAIASGSYRTVIQTLAERTGIRRYFRHIVSDQDVTTGKPDPEIFLKAAEVLGLCPDRCLVIEDSLWGVVAARNAGMSCIAIPSKPYFPEDPRFTPEIVVPGGMEKLDPDELFQEILRAFESGKRNLVENDPKDDQAQAR